jgi:hypothetical protein
MLSAKHGGAYAAVPEAIKLSANADKLNAEAASLEAQAEAKRKEANELIRLADIVDGGEKRVAKGT